VYCTIDLELIRPNSNSTYSHPTHPTPPLPWILSLSSTLWTQKLTILICSYISLLKFFFPELCCFWLSSFCCHMLCSLIYLLQCTFGGMWIDLIYGYLGRSFFFHWIWRITLLQILIFLSKLEIYCLMLLGSEIKLYLPV
jgi:hypothetical protein